MSASNSFWPAILEADIWSAKERYKRKEQISIAGQINQRIYWVQEGLVHFYLPLEKGPQSIRFGYRQNLITSLDSYITGKSSRYQMECLRETELKWCTKKDFEKTVSAHPDGRQNWLNYLQNLVLDLMEREEDLLLDQPEIRLKRVLKRSPQLFQEVPFKYIASYLRMSPETLSRLLKS